MISRIKEFFSKPTIQMILFYILSVSFSYLMVKILKLKINAVYFVAFAFIMYFFIKYYFDNRKKLKLRDKVVSIVFSALLSITFIVQGKIVFSGNVFGTHLENRINQFSFIDIFRFLVVFAGLVIIYKATILFFKKHTIHALEPEEEPKRRFANFKFWLLAFSLVLIPIIVFWLANWPGFFLNDSYNSFKQVAGLKSYNTQHPIVYSLLMGNLLKYWVDKGNSNMGIAIYSIIQFTIMAGIISYFLLWLKKKGIRKELLIATYLFFTTSSLMLTYYIILWKDTLFSGALLLMALFLYDIIDSDGKMMKKLLNYIPFFIISFFIFFWRNNGIYILALIYLTLLIMYNKKLLRFNIMNIVFLIAFIIVQRNIYETIDIRELNEEALTVPLQQFVRTIVYSGDIAEEDMEVFNTFITTEKAKSLYVPMCVDNLKWNSAFSSTKFNRNKIDFLKAWWNTLPKNFNIYVEQYLLGTYGFWSFGTFNWYEAGLDSYHIIVNNLHDFSKSDFFEEHFDLPIASKYGSPTFIGSGTMFWIMMASTSVLFLQKKNKYVISYLPCMGSWITLMLATPVSFALRYTYMFMISLPLFFLMPFFEIKRLEEKDINDSVEKEESDSKEESKKEVT